MCAAMRHRGPDGEGYFDEAPAWMGNRRLSIIDPEGGDQPLFNEDRSLVLVFNGEIYNFVEIRRLLLERGHRFRSGSDGEVILHLYEEKGIGLVDEINGIYVFCLWDRTKRTGYLVRDRLGVKPLYYSRLGAALYFASEIKALRSSLHASDLDRGAIGAYLCNMFVPTPRTPFVGVAKLPPATYLRFDEGGVSDPLVYWSLPQETGGAVRNGTARMEFLGHLDRSLRMQLRSDVPVGISLSGGMDSGLVGVKAAAESAGCVRTYSVCYEDAVLDETFHAVRLARELGFNHEIVHVRGGDVISVLPRLVWHMDEPHADSAAVGSLLLAERAARDVKVLLTGVGGDELFAGYWWHLWDPSKIESGEKRTFNGGLFAPDLAGKFFGDAGRYAPWMADVGASPRQDPLNRILQRDVRFYLADDLLMLLDKMTMAASMEGRVPLLDHRFVEWCFTIPGDWKIHGRETKSLLKSWCRGVLPDYIIDRPKMGFGAPVDAWMSGRLGKMLLTLVERRPKERDHEFWGLRGDRLGEFWFSLEPGVRYLLGVLEVWNRVVRDGWGPETGLEEMIE